MTTYLRVYSRKYVGYMGNSTYYNSKMEYFSERKCSGKRKERKINTERFYYFSLPKIRMRYEQVTNVLILLFLHIIARVWPWPMIVSSGFVLTIKTYNYLHKS